MIPRFLTSFIPSPVRARGEDYVRGRRVRFARATSDEIAALVQGTDGYLVRLSAAPGKLSLSCTCPYAADHLVCKHQWAVLRRADAEGKLRRLLNLAGPRPELSAKPGDTDPEDGEPYDDTDEEDLLALDEPWLANNGIIPVARAPLPPRAAAKPAAPEWKRQLESVLQGLRYPGAPRPAPPGVWPDRRRLVYVVDIPASAHTGGLMVELAVETAQRDGTWGAPVQFRLGQEVWLAAPDPADQRIAQMLLGASLVRAYQERPTLTSGFLLRGPALDTTLRAMCDTGRCRVRFQPEERPTEPVGWKDGPLWRLRLRILEAEPDRFALTGLLERPGEEMPLGEPRMLHVSGVLLRQGGLERFDDAGAWPLVVLLRDAPSLALRRHELPDLLGILYSLPQVPSLDLPAGTAIIESTNPPVPFLRIASNPSPWVVRSHPLALEFRYGDAADRVRAGWRVEVEGALYRAPGKTRAVVRSGIDWFDLDAAVRFGEEEVALPRLIEALASGQPTIALGDGSVGVLPAEWLARLRPILATGTGSNGVTRFARSQIGLLTALLATLPEASADETFEAARVALRDFDRVAAARAPAGFAGTLRHYQTEGLGWLGFLRRFRLGGCLADDMGLGKTVQVLALLESVRLEGSGPSIVVVPRSLVFNWMREAARFTPKLRVLDHSSLDRSVAGIDPKRIDVVLTTYGALRRDAPELRTLEFEYAILDEAQAIKNAGTATAKAARLLRARHRLALSGTPIENRLEELWSLFEFLNPGMLGSSSGFAAMARLGGDRELLGRALRPVILRRTKEQVAPELPDRVEQTLEVELEPSQRKFYDALLARLRAGVLTRVDRVGMNGARMLILTALLRLRQAACHPVLADAAKAELPSAKLDALLPALTEIAAEGHKAVVFSQFTSFLALVQKRLDKAGLPYEYLDGRVRDRQARVDRFQEDPATPLFLVSLKAGGHGLNLTAADYVYLLDPWWNPAVEAQAIDRAHRIGQTRRVIATRLVARGTIEEKILALQASKRALADAILGADQGVLAKIGRAELEALLAPAG